MKNGKKNMNDKLKLKGHMKAFMRWPLILSALLIVLNILVYCVSVKAGLVVSAGVLIYVGIAVVVLRCHRPFIVNELILQISTIHLRREFWRNWLCPMPSWI